MAYEVTVETTKDGLTEECNDLYEVFDTGQYDQEMATDYCWDVVATFTDKGWDILTDDSDRVVLVDGGWQTEVRVNEVDVEYTEDGAITVTATS